MSIPNPPHASRRHYRRWEDCRIWREFYIACLSKWDKPFDAEAVAGYADASYAEYRKRFPVATPQLDDDDSDAAITEARPS